jgi:hypothetical protein
VLSSNQPNVGQETEECAEDREILAQCAAAQPSFVVSQPRPNPIVFPFSPTVCGDAQDKLHGP